MKLDKQNLWRGTHKGISFKIVQWNIDHNFPEIYSPTGTWNYYVFIHETTVAKPIFEKLWLPAKLEKIIPKSRGWVTHDYYVPFGSIDMHGGITFYAKHGEIEGFRAVEIGCDYNHLYDNQTAWTVEMVHADCIRTINHLIETFNIEVKE